MSFTLLVFAVSLDTDFRILCCSLSVFPNGPFISPKEQCTKIFNLHLSVCETFAHKVFAITSLLNSNAPSCPSHISTRPTFRSFAGGVTIWRKLTFARLTSNLTNRERLSCILSENSHGYSHFCIALLCSSFAKHLSPQDITLVQYVVYLTQLRLHRFV